MTMPAPPDANCARCVWCHSCGTPVHRAVLAHRRHPQPVAGGQAAEREGGEQDAHRIGAPARVGWRHGRLVDARRTRRASFGGQPPPTTSIPEACSASAPGRTPTRAPRSSASRRRGAPASAWSATSARRVRPRSCSQRRPETVTADGRVQAWLIGSGTDAADRSDAETAALRGILSGHAAGRRRRGRARSRVGRDRAADRHAARRASTRDCARCSGSTRDPATDDAARAASALETAAALGATVVLEGSRHDRRVARRLGDGSRGGHAVARDGRHRRRARRRDRRASSRGGGDGAGPTPGSPLAAAGVWLHGRAGDARAPRRSVRRGGPITALDVADGAPARGRRGARERADAAALTAGERPRAGRRRRGATRAA